MKKIVVLLLSFGNISLAVLSQAYESTIQYDKKKQSAIVIEFAYPPAAVENAFIQRMEKLGYKAKEEKGLLNRDKGFLVFKNANVTEISKDRMDYIINVERKSRKESDEAILYLVMSNDGHNAMAKMESFNIGNAKVFLNNLVPDVEVANLELQIKAQEEIVMRAEKKFNDLQDDKKNLENKLADNAKSQDDTLKDIETQKQSLETLRGKRKKN